MKNKIGVLGLRLKESEINIQNLEQEKEKKDKIRNYTRWIKETEAIIKTHNYAIKELEGHITEYTLKKDLLRKSLFSDQ